MIDWNANNIPNQKEKVAIVTGANTGLDYETTLELAKKEAHVIMVVRDLKKGQAAMDSIHSLAPNAQLSLQIMDLGSLASVHQAATDILETVDRIDLLINNAGVSNRSIQHTVDGFETMFGTNHLGHFVFTGRLLNQIIATNNSRIVTVSSLTHKAKAADNFKNLDDLTYNETTSYGRSKLANLLFTYELQRKLKHTDTIAVAAHPGGSATDLMRNTPKIVQSLMPYILQSPAMGALPTLRATTDLSVLGGQFYGPSGRGQVRGFPIVVTSSQTSYDLKLQKHLWAISEILTQFHYNK